MYFGIEQSIYNFHQDYIKNICGNNLRLLFTDTDNLIMYEIKIKNVYESFSYHKETFDFINYLTNSKYYNSNKLVIGKMKDETSDVEIEEFVGLKANIFRSMAVASIKKQRM